MQRLGLPTFVPDVLPARHFEEDEQTQLVARIEEGGALGVVAGADGVAAQLLFQDVGIKLLDAVRHGIALIGVALVAVQAPHFDPLAVEVEPARDELDGAEAEPGGLFVQHPVGQTAGAGADEPHREGVEEGVVDAPRVDAVQGAHDGQGQLPVVEGAAPGGAADLGLEGAAHGLTHGGGVDAEIALGLCLYEDIAQISGFFHVQRDGAVDAAVGQVIDLAAEGRDVQVLAAVAADGEDVFLPQTEGFGEIDCEGRVAAAMVEHPPPVAEHGGVVGHGVKGEQHGAALPLLRGKKLPPVAAKALVIVFIAVIVGQRLDRVRDAHGFQRKLRALRPHDGGVEGGGEQPAVVPIVMFHSPLSVVVKILILMLPQSCERKSIYLIKFVIGRRGFSGWEMPAALPASMQRSSHAILRPSSRITAQPSWSCKTCSGLEPWTMGQ